MAEDYPTWATELINKVEVVEKEAEAGSIEGMKLLFLTYNSAAEVVYYQVNSSNKETFS